MIKKIGSGVNVNGMLDQELHNSVTKKFKRAKLYASLKDNI